MTRSAGRTVPRAVEERRRDEERAVTGDDRCDDRTSARRARLEAQRPRASRAPPGDGDPRRAQTRPRSQAGPARRPPARGARSTRAAYIRREGLPVEQAGVPPRRSHLTREAGERERWRFRSRNVASPGEPEVVRSRDEHGPGAPARVPGRQPPEREAEDRLGDVGVAVRRHHPRGVERLGERELLVGVADAVAPGEDRCCTSRLRSASKTRRSGSGARRRGRARASQKRADARDGRGRRPRRRASSCSRPRLCTQATSSTAGAMDAVADAALFEWMPARRRRAGLGFRAKRTNRTTAVALPARVASTAGGGRSSRASGRRAPGPRTTPARSARRARRHRSSGGRAASRAPAAARRGARGTSRRRSRPSPTRIVRLGPPVRRVRIALPSATWSANAFSP